MVTHDAHAAAIADRVLFLADGEIVRDLPRCSAHKILETLEEVSAPMIGVALKGLAARKVRALLTALAVVIGVSMISGTYILTDTMQKAFDGIFESSYAETDAVISGKEIVEGSTSGSATVPASLLAKVESLPEVEAAGGTIAADEANKSEIIGHDGKVDRRRRRRADVRARLRRRARRSSARSKLKSGDWAKGAEQVVVDAGTADKGDLAVGDTVKVATLGVAKPYEITGIATFGDVDSLGGATMAIFDMPTAQALLHKEGVYDGISIQAKEGTSPAELVKAVEPLVPDSLQVADAKAQADGRREGDQRGDGVHPLLLPRLRRDRAVRRLVRDLQHPVDHGRPAHARVRDAAHARRVAQAGHALRGARGPRDRPRRLA